MLVKKHPVGMHISESAVEYFGCQSECDHCNEPIANGSLAIEWHGGPDFTMHIECATHVCIRVLRDIHEADCKMSDEQRQQEVKILLTKLHPVKRER